jgi:hypothetical protein
LFLSDPPGPLQIRSSNKLSISRTTRASILKVESFGNTEELRPSTLTWVIQKTGAVESIWGLLTIAGFLAAWLLPRKG